jgi:1,4-alpha-glucan branching enzyme
MQLLEADPPKRTKKPSTVPVKFKLHAPHAKRVHVAGDFTNWHAAARPLTRAPDGSWFADLRLKPGRYQYKFIVDEEWQNDPAQTETEPDSFGGVNNVIDVKEL